MFCTDTTPPPIFVYQNLTPYQFHVIKEKWYIYNYVNDSDKEKMQCFRELADELGKNYTAIRNMYYEIKPIQDEL
jgi:hypothetical protein